jgi:hypothetical protein
MEIRKESKIGRREFLGCTAGALGLATSSAAVAQTQDKSESRAPLTDFNLADEMGKRIGWDEAVRS